ncbi:MAG: GAF domain-containing protein, partial [bacterium]
MRVVAERLAPLVSASAVGLGLIDGDEIVYRGPGADAASGTRVALAASLSGQCVATRSAVQCHDTQRDGAVAQAETRAAGVRSLLIVPLTDES